MEYMRFELILNIQLTRWLPVKVLRNVLIKKTNPICSLFSGVDIVLNSLAAEKLEASLRVLAVHGRFLEIGKYDLSQNTGLGK